MSLEYLLQYAGIPFNLDSPDLIEELDRLMPFRYLQDFTKNPKVPGRSLDALIGSNYFQEVKIGEWYYPCTASRFSIFRGLATSSQTKAMLSVTKGTSPAPFVMKQVPIQPGQSSQAKYTLTSSMYMLPPRPLAEHGGGFDGLYLITLVDERFYWQDKSSSLRPTSSSTWNGLLVQLAADLGITLTSSVILPVYSSPEPDSQLWTNVENSALLLDAVAANVGRVVVRNLDGTYKLQTPSEARVTIVANRGTASSVVRMAGGDIFNPLVTLKVGSLAAAENSIIPSSVVTTFPKYITSGVPHFLNPRYQNQRPSAWYEDSYGDVVSVSIPITSGNLAGGITGIAGLSHTIHSTAKAYYPTEADAASGNVSLNPPGPITGITGLSSDHTIPMNASGLTSLAIQLAVDYYGWQVAASLDEVYPGTYAWVPEGINDIVWSYSASRKQASTRVMRRSWDQVIQNVQHAAHAQLAETIIPRGVAGPSVAQTIQDSWPTSGFIPQTYLTTALASGDMKAAFRRPDFFPTQNRWVGTIDNERILFEGTSGGTAGGGGLTSVDIVYRGIDGTIQTSHQPAANITQVLPTQTFGVNLITYEKGQFVYPSEWTSGGLRGVSVVPQIQTVLCLSSSGIQMPPLNNVTHYSGSTIPYAGNSPFTSGESVWIFERNNQLLRSGMKYDGQLVGYSASTPDNTAPVYAVNAIFNSGQFQNLRVQQVDLLQPVSMSGIGQILFDQVDGFKVSSPASGTAKINLTPGVGTTVSKPLIALSCGLCKNMPNIFTLTTGTDYTNDGCTNCASLNSKSYDLIWTGLGGAGPSCEWLSKRLPAL